MRRGRSGKLSPPIALRAPSEPKTLGRNVSIGVHLYRYVCILSRLAWGEGGIHVETDCTAGAAAATGMSGARPWWSSP